MNNYKLILISCLIGFTACDEPNVAMEKEDSASNALKKDSIVLDEAIQQKYSEQLELKPEVYSSTNLDSLGIELMSLTDIGGVKIGMDTSEVALILGQPEMKSEPEYWAVDGGIHEFWYYRDSSLVLEFVNYSYHEDNNLEIIELRDSCEFKTDRGISIGSNLEMVKSNYAKAIDISDWKEGENQILLGDPGSAGLFFTICEDIICKIRIGAIIRC
jgi:hypothetical protein